MDKKSDDKKPAGPPGDDKKPAGPPGDDKKPAVCASALTYCGATWCPFGAHSVCICDDGKKLNFHSFSRIVITS